MACFSISKPQCRATASDLWSSSKTPLPSFVMVDGTCGRSDARSADPTPTPSASRATMTRRAHRCGGAKLTPLHQTDRDDAVVAVVGGVTHPEREEARAREGQAGLDAGQMRQPLGDGLDRLLDSLGVEGAHVDRT